MPFFLFIVGLSLTLSFDRLRQEAAASKSGDGHETAVVATVALPQTVLLRKSFLRAVKLFLLGILIQVREHPMGNNISKDNCIFGFKKSST